MKKKKKQVRTIKDKGLIKKSMIFTDIINKYPEALEVMMNKGLHCVGCGMAAYETLEQGAMMHGIDPDKLVKELNTKISKKNKK
jgi:hybrid cluster-associated redox disulfide protein